MVPCKNQIAKSILGGGGRNKARGIMLPDFKLYYKALLIKQYGTDTKNRHIEQWNKIVTPEINPGIYDQLIFDKRAKNTQWGTDSLFNKFC